MNVKFLFLFCICFILQYIPTNAQTFAEKNKFSLMKPENKSRGVYLYSNINEVKRILGEPTSVQEEYNEMEEAMAKVLFYKTNRLSFINDSLYSYEIKTADILVGTINGKTFKIGDKIETKKITIPLGPAPFDPVKTEIIHTFMDYNINIEKGASRNISYTAYLTLELKDNSNYIDTFAEFLFNDNTLTNFTIYHP